MGRTLLERTLRRTSRTIPLARTLVVVNRDHLPIAHAQLRDVLPLNLIVQPENRDTGPGVSLSLAMLERRDPEATVAVFPSDHWIGCARRFMRHVERAADAVSRWPERIAVLGIHPTRPDPECGYLTRGWPLEMDAPSSAFTVGAFFERPDAMLAERLARRGGLWNSSVTVFRVAAMLAELERLVPRRLEVMRRLSRRPDDRRAAYAAMDPWSFGCEVFARLVHSLIVVPVADVTWSEWRTPLAVVRSLAERAEKPPWWPSAAALVA